MKARTQAARASRGLSLVEVLVGLVIGLFIAAAGATLLAAQWREHRSATVEMRLMQELRGTTELIVRDLRRAGHWGDAAAGLWAPGASAPLYNPYAALAPAGAASNAAAFGYSRDTSENHLLDANEQFGLRLRNGVIELQLGAGNWQALTDAGTMVVDELRITPTLQELPLLEHCPRPCPTGAACAAAVQVRSFALQIGVHAAADAGVKRRLHSEVRVRNDALRGACPA
jgi:type IV pilus assembly protein PilW